ncbi:MAG: type III restriction endonuclease subunit R [Verrucomicrobiota bacterium]|jgi:type III restriction enzyme
MSNFEVPSPVLCSPFAEPAEHWWILEGQPAERRPGRRPAIYFYREPAKDGEQQGGLAIEMKLVNRIRQRVRAWRDAGYAGVTRTTHELIEHWRREERAQRLFFAQLEAVETVIFLTEARPDFRQGIEVPMDEPSEERRAEGFTGFARYACKIATGSGKTTVMGMLAAWSILNKVNDRGDARFSDVVLVVVPNVTIRDRCRELDPQLGNTSLYRTRDLVPSHLMERLRQGRVIVTNWHVFEPQSVHEGDAAMVVKRGREILTTETVRIGDKNDTKRGTRFLTRESIRQQLANGLLERVEGDPETDAAIKVRSRRYVESDAKLMERVLGREIGGKQNILVLNDEAHHAYRIKKDEPDDDEAEEFGEDEEAEAFFKEATVWIDGLDRIQRLRGINFCVDLSATPYFLGRVGQQTNRPFPWVVSDFSLMDAIESGLVKIPQLAVRDTTGAEIPGYFNIWRWILQPGRLTPSERGGKLSAPKPEAVLKWANTPIAMLAGLWEAERTAWQASGEPRPPVFILVCKNTALANVVYEWIAHDKCPAGIPPAKIHGFRNSPCETNTIIVHSKVVHETDTGEAKGDESRWMRFTLDTVGRQAWPTDTQGRTVWPEGFEELARKLGRPLHPPGRDVRCIVSVAMLTEGWDCNTVTHIVGLRPFQSQLLCEQVVGRGLRRASYEIDEQTGLMREEVAKVFGVPFEVVPFKANPNGPVPPPAKRHHVRALPDRAHLEIRFPRVEGYTQSVRNHVTMDWQRVPAVLIKPDQIPPEVQVKGLNLNNNGRLSLLGPGAEVRVTLAERRARLRVQELVFDVARTLTHDFIRQRGCTVPPAVLFPQIARIVDRYVRTEVAVQPPGDLRDLHFAPYFGWLTEVLLEHIHGDVTHGETPERPRYESSRAPGSTAAVDFWTSRDVREVHKSHVNAVVADTRKWEQTAAFYIDSHPQVDAFVKNAGLGFAIPYLHNGQKHDYIPDFILRLTGNATRHLILETKGFDPLADLKKAAAERWVAAVNDEGSFGHWTYRMARKPEDVVPIIHEVAKPQQIGG